MKLDFPEQQVDSVRIMLRTRRLLWLLIPGALAFGLLAGLAVGGLRTDVAPPAGGERGPCRVTATDVVVGCPNTREGAVAAAGSVVAVFTGPRMLNPAERQDTIRALAAPGAADDLARLGEGIATDFYEVAYGNAPQGAAIMLRGFPLLWRVESYTPQEARVVVWQSVVMNGPNLKLPKVVYGGDTVTLEWHGDWKVRSVKNANLPTLPGDTTAVPTPADSFGQQLSGFQPFRLVGDAQ